MEKREFSGRRRRRVETIEGVCLESSGVVHGTKRNVKWEMKKKGKNGDENEMKNKN